jgi:hypothetical protein
MKYLSLIFLFIPTLLISQGWEKTFGSKNSEDIGFSVQQTNDGGYIITGETKSITNNSDDVYLIKTDAFGNALWTKTIGGRSRDIGTSVYQTLDGGFIITGLTWSFGGGSNVYLIKTDNKGDTIWTKKFGGKAEDIGYSVQQTTDGGYIIAGRSSSFGNGGVDVYLIKTDINGDSIWTKTYGGNGTNIGYSVQQTTDEGYIIVGSTSASVTSSSDVFLIKTDFNGDTLWTKIFGGEKSDVGFSVRQTTDEGYIIAGSTSSFGYGSNDVYLIKTDYNGNYLWSKTYGGEGLDIGYSVQQTADEGYIICGYIRLFDNFFNQVYLIKTDSNGDSIWTRTFGGEHDDKGRSVQQTTDGGYIIAGLTNPYGNGNDDVYLIKTDENGLTPIIEIPVTNLKSKLLKLIDLSGREISKPEKNQPYIELFDDGTTKKILKLN